MPLGFKKSDKCLCNRDECEKSPLPKDPSLDSYLFFGDGSLDIWKDVRSFVEKRIENHGNRVFVSKVAMKPTIVVASNALVREFLYEKAENSTNALQKLFFGLFGKSILFAPTPGDAKRYRSILVPLFSNFDYERDLNSACDRWLNHTIPVSEPVVPYGLFKRFSTVFNLKIFMGLEEDDPLTEEISRLATTHWHGIISVPVNLQLFLMSSSYRKAQDAKNKLLTIVEERLSQSPFMERLDSEMEDRELLKNHALIFICALIPKALASVMGSFVDSARLWHPQYVDSNGHIDEADLECILLETLRLWPPFIGSFRESDVDIELGSYHIPKGTSVFCVALSAHRDPEVFQDPEKFDPERWKRANAGDKDKMFGFGGGLHGCIGEKMCMMVMKKLATEFLKRFIWEFDQDFPQNTEIKYLPVLRRKVLKPVILKLRQ